MYSRLKRVPTLKGDLVGQTARLPVPLGMPGLCLVVGTSDQGLLGNNANACLEAQLQWGWGFNRSGEVPGGC